MTTPEGQHPPKTEKTPDTAKPNPAVLDVVAQTREAAQNMHGTKLFPSEDEARAYLEKNVPQKEQDKEIDLAPLKESLFDTPETPTPGHYEFKGENGISVSFDLTAADDAFDRCWQLYRGEEDHIQGNYRPIFVIRNLRIETEKFSYSSDELERPVSITWLPNLSSSKTEFTSVMTYTKRGREIYLMGRDGWHARPIDLLGLFHELGHSETRSPEDKKAEDMSIQRTITGAGVKTEPFKKAALELQREKDANSWMSQKTRQLFQDLNIPQELIDDYIEHVQMRSYYNGNRQRLAEGTEQEK